MIVFSAKPSHGARELASELDVYMAKRKSNRLYRGTVINWGCVDLPDRFRIARRVINKGTAIAEVSNKLTFFRKMKDHDITPWFTTDKAEASEQMAKIGCSMVCRTVLSGSGGVGITLAASPDELINAPLYVQYIPKDTEWRVHVFRMANGCKVVDVQKKAKRNDVDDAEVNWKIRNLEGGFIYKRNDIDPPSDVLMVACKCMEILSLDFGAVDVIYSKKNKRAFVLEVNSAPGLEGTTVVNYAKAFQEMMHG